MYIANDLAGKGDFGLYAKSEQLSMSHVALGILDNELQCRRMLYCKSNILAWIIALSRSISGSSVVGWVVSGGCGTSRGDGWAVGGGCGTGCGIDRCAVGGGCDTGWGIDRSGGCGGGWGAGCWGCTTRRLVDSRWCF